MAVLTAVSVSRSGLSLTATVVAASAGGDSWANNGSELLFVQNAGGSSVTLTFAPTALADGQAFPTRTVEVTAGSRVLVGPFPQALFNDGNQRAGVSYSGVTGVSVCVVRPG